MDRFFDFGYKHRSDRDPIITTVTWVLEMMVVITTVIPPDPLPLFLRDIGIQGTLYLLLLLEICGCLLPEKT